MGINNSYKDPEKTDVVKIDAYRHKFSPQNTKLKGEEKLGFINHIFWIMENEFHKVSGSHSTVVLNPLQLQDDHWGTMVKVENFHRNLANTSPISTKKPLFDPSSNLLIQKICFYLGIFLTPEQLFLRKLQNGLDEGTCLGTSMALLSFMNSNKCSLSEARSQIELSEIARIQIMHDLKSNLHDQMYQLDQAGLTDSPKFREGFALYQELENAINNLSRISESKKFSMEQADVSQISAHLSSRTGKAILNYLPAEGVGHSVILDLNNNEFLDNNAGIYKYDTKKQLIEQVLTRMSNVYIDSVPNGGKIEIHISP